MVAPKGNRFAKKLKTKEIKEAVYADFCDHIAQGRKIKSWHYQRDGLSVSWQTILHYAKTDPDLDPERLEIAKAEGLLYWEEICGNAVFGKNIMPTRSLLCIMRNKFKN